MKILGIIIISFFLHITTAISGDVHVKGYYRKNGTYVQPHVRSKPDGKKANNYGPSKGNGYLSPSLRDSGGDGISNQYDNDDDNDGVPDEKDSSQY